MDASFILHKGHVTHVIDPSSFWMWMGTDADFLEFQEYQKTLDQFYSQTGRRNRVWANSLSAGDCVMVANTGQRDITSASDEDRTQLHWSRAKVSRVEGDQVDVFYIDHGNTEIVNISNVKNIEQELFDYIPPQVIQLGIAGIKPLSRSWTSRAIAIFESRVVKQEVVASLIEYDDTNKYGQVVIYIRHDDSSWRSLTNELLDEELGLPVEPRFHEFLSQEVVLTALKRAEQDSSSHSLENDSDGDDDDDDSKDKDTEGSQQQGLTASSGQPMPAQKSGSYHADSTLQSEPVCAPMLDCENSSVGVPAFDLRFLEPTRFLSLAKMHEDKNEEHRQEIRTRLEREVHDCDEEEEAEDTPEIEWGKTDLKIGEAAEFPDFNNYIRDEIYKHSPRQSGQDDFTEFSHEPAIAHRNQSTPEQFNFQEVIQISRQKANMKALSEVEDYKIQKKIEEILLGKDHRDQELVCVLINSIIEPDVDALCDRLVAVFTAILETLIHHSDVDRLFGIGALETYLETRSFNEAIETTLISLCARFMKVKLTQTTSSSGLHQDFSDVLAVLFMCADRWPPSACSAVQTFVMRSLDHWAIFNKQRVQNGETWVTLENLYLECVETITDIAWEMMNRRFPDHCCSLIEEIKHKLLHDGTHRNVRVQLLNILLKWQENKYLSTRATPSIRDVAVQTENINDSHTITASQDTVKNMDFSGSDTALNGSLRSQIYPPCLPYTPDLDENFETSETCLEDSLLDPYNENVYSGGCAALLPLCDVGTSGYSQTGNHKMQISPTVSKHLTHQHNRLPLDIDYSDKRQTGEAKDVHRLQQPAEYVLNVHAPEYSEQTDKKLCLSGAQKSRPVTDIGRTSKSSPHDIYSDALNPEEFSMGPDVRTEVMLSRSGTDDSSCDLGVCVNESGEHEASGNSDEMYASVCSSPADLDKSLSDLNVGSPTKAENKLVKIKYTSLELKALNTQSPAPGAALETVSEACEIDFAAQNVQVPPCSSERRDEQPQRTISGAPLHRYSGSGDRPIEVSQGPKSNAANWKSLSEFLSESCFTGGYTNRGTSVDPEHLNNQVNDLSSKAKSSSLKDIAKDLIFSPPEKNLGSGEGNALSNDKYNALSNDKYNGCTEDEINFCDSVHSVVVSSSLVEKLSRPEWPETFIQSVAPVPETKSTSAVNVEHSNTSKGKKKKIKFRPIREVFAQKSTSPDDQTEVCPSDLDFEDNSLRDLQMQINEADGRIISQSRIGALSGRSSNRSSLLGVLRQEQPKASPWVPRIRRCTRCGSIDHTVYDCAGVDPLRRLNDQDY